MNIEEIPAYFRVLFRSQTWRNIAYLLLAFPTGLFYFVAFSIGLSLAGSLLIIGVGFLILFATGIGMLSAGEFERRLSNSLLGTEIQPLPTAMRNTDSFSENLKAMFSVSMIRITIYVFTKFIFGIFALVAAILAVALPLAAVLMPIGFLANDPGFQPGPDEIQSFPEAIFFMVIMLGISPLLLHGTNLLTAFWRVFTESMLGYSTDTVQVPYVYADDSYPAKRKNDLADEFGEDVYIAKPKRKPEAPASDARYDYNQARATSASADEEPPKRSLGDLVRQTMEMEEEQNTSNGAAQG